MMLPQDPRDPRLRRFVRIGGSVAFGVGAIVLPAALTHFARQDVVGLTSLWGTVIAITVLFLAFGVVWTIAMFRMTDQELAYTKNVLVWVREANDEELERLSAILPSYRDLRAFVRIEREERARARERASLPPSRSPTSGS